MTTTDVLDVERDVAVAAVRRPRPWRRTKWIAGVLAFAIFAAALTSIVSSERHANTEFTQAYASLRATQSHLHDVLTSLATVRAELARDQRRVRLDSISLAKDRSQLEAVRTALTNTKTKISNQTTAINDLSVCLGGVEGALNSLAIGDQRGAFDGLESVATSCTGAAAFRA